MPLSAFQAGLDEGHSAIKARFHGGKRCPSNLGDFLEGKILVESENEHFAVEGIELEQCGPDLFSILHIRHVIERARIAIGDLECERTVIVSADLEKLVQAGHGPFPALVDDQVASDGKEPGLESGFAVKLAATGKDAHPDLLEEVLSLFAIPGQKQ